MANEIRCSNCGKICKERDSYCKNCGETIVKAADTYGMPIEGVEVEKWEEFIGEGANSFIPTFRKNEGKKIFISANFGALVFAQTWMFYRKMCVEALITCLVGLSTILLGFGIFMINSFAGIMVLLPLVISYRLAICIFADAIYKAHIKREISKNAPDMRKGGTSVGIAIVGSLAFSAILTIVELAFELLA